MKKVQGVINAIILIANGLTNDGVVRLIWKMKKAWNMGSSLSL